MADRARRRSIKGERDKSPSVRNSRDSKLDQLEGPDGVLIKLSCRGRHHRETGTRYRPMGQSPAMAPEYSVLASPSCYPAVASGVIDAQRLFQNHAWPGIAHTSMTWFPGRRPCFFFFNSSRPLGKPGSRPKRVIVELVVLSQDSLQKGTSSAISRSRAPACKRYIRCNDHAIQAGPPWASSEPAEQEGDRFRGGWTMLKPPLSS